MRISKDGKSLNVIPNLPAFSRKRKHIKTRVWVNYTTPGEYELVADFVRKEDGYETKSFSQAELEELRELTFLALDYMRKDVRWRRISRVVARVVKFFL